MKVVTAAQMRALDERTVAAGLPGILLMEAAAAAVIAAIPPGRAERVVIYCGPGNNGGDGLAIARQLQLRHRPAVLDVLLVGDPLRLKGDAAISYAAWCASGGTVGTHATPAISAATLVIDALLGTGTRGPATGAMLAAIQEINTAFPAALIVSVDVPSGMPSDGGEPTGEHVRPHQTVTFTAPRIAHVLPPNCEAMGRVTIAPIGTPAEWVTDDRELSLSVTAPAEIAPAFAPRASGSNKGSFGHVLVTAGARGKTGAAALAGMAALRVGAGLVTVATPQSAQDSVAQRAAELMTVALPETAAGALSEASLGAWSGAAQKKTVLAIGPGLGTAPETVAFVRAVFEQAEQPLVVDADALNALAESDWRRPTGLRVLTPHPGEMGRLLNVSIAKVQADRLAVAQSFAQERGVCLVLKGQRTVVAWPDGRVWINPTGSPALATGGTGDVLTGLIAGMLAQFPHDPMQAVLAAVYLHGLAGQWAARHLGEQAVLAGDLFTYLPQAMHEISHAQ